jgi:hypothetical protein
MKELATLNGMNSGLRASQTAAVATQPTYGSKLRLYQT